MRVGIAYSSKDRVELTKRTLPPLSQRGTFDTWWFDGSQTEEGEAYFAENGDKVQFATRLTGGSCRYIVCALTALLDHGREDDSSYDFIGLVENDVLLDDDWFPQTMALFNAAMDFDLQVGAVSARTYEDRILIQRDGYALMHNLGAGMIIFSRQAAALVLNQYRTGWTGENRKVFSMLSGIDIGRYWAFKGLEQMLVADWSYDRMIAQVGMCSLALVPAKAHQLEDIEKQGLKSADQPVDGLRNDKAFGTFCERTHRIRDKVWSPPATPGARLFYDGVWTIFPHQIFTLGGSYSGDWRFKWAIGWGCFAWRAGAVPKQKKFNGGGNQDIDASTFPTAVIPVLGPLDVIVSGGEGGGKVKVEDELSGFSAAPELGPESMQGPVQLAVPGAMGYRNVKLTALTPGIVFYGIRTREAQPYVPVPFDFHSLPPL